MKKKNISTLILVLVILLGIGIILYPSVSNWWNSRIQTQYIVNYENTMYDIGKVRQEEALAQAEKYNAQLKELDHPFADYGEVPGYEDTLNVTKDGIMGYITIDRIGVQLPIYHGTSEGVLNVAVGHMEGSSLPVGGEGTHCVLAGHCGLPSARLFTDLDELTEGDTFVLKVFDRTLTYEVDQIRIVEPDEMEALYAVEGKDYCTLLTCTPYGVNTQRLLVRGLRVENADEDEAEIAVTSEVTEASDTNKAYELDLRTLAPAVAAPLLILLLILLLIMLVKNQKRKRKGRRDRPSKREENDDNE